MDEGEGVRVGVALGSPSVAVGVTLVSVAVGEKGGDVERGAASRRPQERQQNIKLTDNRKKQ